MKKDIEQINIEFNVAAQKSFFNVCERFEMDLGRCRHENEYIQLHAMYVELLKSSLETAAFSMIEQYNNMYDVFLLRKAVTVHIDRYLGEFRFKYRLDV
ncbi:hypothetical protein SAMN05421788_10527 [Filimonas lacunae]|uniref:Uncharacterized protein n=1 Tax=Filimonas lacunae TaxID=477680 RepID=A0A173MD87_9BACT|nr:hypothetical protein [Filimonas lacunae]BAV05525.1 hypothetical protein FLA_1532 [Filimonas lacunae]SIT20565.1 hypothetical protein SAMN05421788_10527 [Filimonas lacunae]